MVKVNFGSDSEVGRRNPDFRSFLNRRHSPMRRSRPKSAISRHRKSREKEVLSVRVRFVDDLDLHSIRIGVESCIISLAVSGLTRIVGRSVQDFGTYR
jgi:hypothetical protein